MKLFLFNLATLLAMNAVVFAQYSDSTMHGHTRFSLRQLYSPVLLIMGRLISNGSSEPYASYSVSSSVGLLHKANNRHYISDVLVGAGIGYLAMKTAYWTHRYKWRKRRQNAAKTAF